MARFADSEIGRELAGAVRDLLAATLTPPLRAAAATDPAARRGAVWKQLADAGVFGLLVPETHGGLGLSEPDAVGVLEELGRAAVAGPIAETAFVAAPVLAAPGPAGSPSWAERWLPDLVAGDLAVAPAMIPGGYLPDGDVCDLLLFLAPDGDEVRFVPAGEVTLVDQPAVDPTRRLAALGQPGALGDAADPLVAGGWAARPGVGPPGVAGAAVDRAVLATAAQLVGAGRHLLETTVAYAGTRRQFGRQIGSYQAVKHRLADVELKLAFARPLVGRAAYSLAGGRPTASRDCSAAKVAAAGAAEFAARAALQVHGAIGYTDELDLGAWLKRVWWLAPAWGDPGWHRARVAADLIDAGHLARTP